LLFYLCDVGRVAFKHCFKLLSFFYIYTGYEAVIVTAVDVFTEHEITTAGSGVIWLGGFCRKGGVEYIIEQRLICKLEQFGNA